MSPVRTFTVAEQFGVAHPDQIIDFNLDTPVDAPNSCLIAPDGRAVPCQPVDGGKRLAVRSRLPGSRLALRRALGRTTEEWAANYTFDQAGVEGCLSVDGPVFAVGDAVHVEGNNLPVGLQPDTDYYVAKLEFRGVQGWGFWFVALSESLDGPPVTTPKSGSDAFLVPQGIVADPTTDQLYARGHGLRDGEPVRVRSEGILPQPLQPDREYVVHTASADGFQLAAERGGPPLDLLTSGHGIHELLIEWTWTLQPGREPEPSVGGVTVTGGEAAGTWEISNGRLGIRIPVDIAPAAAAGAPAPIQGIRLADGTWTGTNGVPNTITFTPGTEVDDVAVTFLERGPLTVVAEIAYTLTRAEFRYGGTLVCPAGAGRYSARIEVQAGQPSVLVEEDTDCQFSYSFPFPGITLDQARYRGHSVRDKRHGYRPDGKAVANRAADTFFDLPFDADYSSGYTTDFGSRLIRWMHPWDPWIFDSGNYWMLYDKNGGDDAPLIGFYDGRASRLRDAGAVGVGVFTKSAANGGPTAGITVQAWQRAPDARLFATPRFQWRLFVGTKGTDMADWREVQPINRQMNLHSGINLNKISRLGGSVTEPQGGFGGMYMRPDAVTAMVETIRTDPEFYRFAYNAVSYYRDLIDMWRDDSGGRVHRMANGLLRGGHDALNTLVHGQGIWGFGYWHAGLEASRALMRIDQVLAATAATPLDRAAVETALLFYATVLWDDDHAPLSVPAGVNLGTANMPVQQQNYREMYALYLPRHPMMAGRADSVWGRARTMIRGTVNEHGAHMGCTHYIGAAMGPLLSTLQQLQQAGIADPFAEEPRLKNYAEFEMNFCTPVDPRFGKRVRPAIGDSEPGEATEFLGQLATAYAELDPDLSARLMGAWRQSGRPHSDFHGATILKIDERLAGVDPALTSAHVEGWYSVLRFGWGTPNETAAWFVNGGWYRDHASNDLGEAVIYALGAPLSLDFGTMYSPISPGGFVHSVVLPESAIGVNWKTNPPPLDRGPRWKQAKTAEFAAEQRQARSRATFTMGGLRWTRTLKVAMLRDDLPAIGVRDTFTGEGAATPKIFLLNLMADGAVQTADGPRQVGDSFAIPAGITRLGFTGQTFKQHPTTGIDWDLYVVADTPQEAFLAQYEHTNRGGERQIILRLRGNGGFQVVIVPRAKGTPVEGLQVALRDGGLTVAVPGEMVRF